MYNLLITHNLYSKTLDTYDELVCEKGVSREKIDRMMERIGKTDDAVLWEIFGNDGDTDMVIFPYDEETQTPLNGAIVVTLDEPFKRS